MFIRISTKVSITYVITRVNTLLLTLDNNAYAFIILLNLIIGDRFWAL